VEFGAKISIKLMENGFFSISLHRISWEMQYTKVEISCSRAEKI